MANAKKPAPAGPATKGLRIISRSPDGFRRCGRAWNAEGTTVSLAELTEEQVEILRAEKQLVVVDVEIDATA